MDPTPRVRRVSIASMLATAALLAGSASPLSGQTPVSWSPHGDSIAIATTVDGREGIHVIAADGSGGRLLYAMGGLETYPAYPAWSPDGAWIAYSSKIDGDGEIYRISIDGGEPVRLTDDDALDSYPAWSPDGARLAFMSNRTGNWQIYVMNADGSKPRRLTHSEGNDWNPSWSPDGSRLVYETNRHGGGQDEIYVIDVQTGEETRLTETAGNDIFPDWSSTGAIAYCTVASRHAVVNVVEPSGGGARQLVDDACLPRWSPDGTRLAFDRAGSALVMNLADGIAIHMMR